MRDGSNYLDPDRPEAVRLSVGDARALGEAPLDCVVCACVIAWLILVHCRVATGTNADLRNTPVSTPNGAFSGAGLSREDA
jgi:hypothetical protein